MRICLQLMLGLMLAAQASAQSINKIFEGKTNCQEIEKAALDAIPRLYNQQLYDSIELVLDYVDLFCTASGPLKLTRILTDLQLYHTLQDTLLADEVAWLAYNTRQVHRHTEALRKNLTNTWETPEAKREYERKFWDKYRHNQMAMLKMWSEWASALLPRQAVGSGGALVCSLASGLHNRMYPLVRQKKYRDHPLATAYTGYHSRVVHNRTLVTQVLAGFAVPGHARLQSMMHTTPALGIAAGYLTNGHRIEAFMSHRLAGSFTNKAYQVVRPDTTFFSRGMYNLQGGLNYARTIWQPNWLWRINLFAGGGLEHWRMFEPLERYDDNFNDLPRNIAINDKMGEYESFAFFWQSGLEVQHSITPGSNMGLQLRYQQLNHKSTGTIFYGGMWVLSMQWSAHSFGKLAVRNALVPTHKQRGR